MDILTMKEVIGMSGEFRRRGGGRSSSKPGQFSGQTTPSLTIPIRKSVNPHILPWFHDTESLAQHRIRFQPPMFVLRSRIQRNVDRKGKARANASIYDLQQSNFWLSKAR